jgi:hypothetical protein
MKVWYEFTHVGFKDVITDVLYQIVVYDHGIRYSVSRMLFMVYFLLPSSG